MSLADDLYRETILDHYHNPRNHGEIDHPSTTVEGINPLCGDELTLYLEVKDKKIENVKLKAKGCSINTASGSMMSEALIGKTIDEANEIIELFKKMMLAKNEEVILPDELDDLEALQGVKKYPVRIKCALLPWNTMLEGIGNLETTNGHNKPVAGG